MTRDLDALRARLGDGDLTCDLCDAGAASPLAVDWPVAFGPEAFAGPARTVSIPEGDVAAIDRVLDELAAGEVIVVASGSEAAVWGVRLGGRARERGAAGVVVAGRVRDVPALRALDLPLKARGVAPHRSPARADGAVDAPVEIGGARIRPGDRIVADANGVVVLHPREEAPA